MSRIAYIVVPNRSPTYIRFVDEKYIPAENEMIIEGDTLPVFPLTDLELAEIEAIRAAEEAKQAAYIENLPSWKQVKTAIEGIDSIAGVKLVLLRIARVVYWMVRNSAT